MQGEIFGPTRGEGLHQDAGYGGEVGLRVTPRPDPLPCGERVALGLRREVPMGPFRTARVSQGRDVIGRPLLANGRGFLGLRVAPIAWG